MAGGDYGRVRHTFWTDPDIKRVLTPEQKTLLLYYFTSPHRTLIGLYYCPLEYAASETGLPLEQVREWTTGALSRFVTYDVQTEEILVHRAGRHQVGDVLAEKDNQRKAIEKACAEAHSATLVRRFLELYEHWSLAVPVPPEPEAPSKPLASPFEAKAVAVAVTEQEETEAKASEAAPRCEGMEPGDSALPMLVAPLVREHLWLGKDPPHEKIGDRRSDMGREITAAKHLAKMYGVDAVVGMIPYARMALNVTDGRRLSLLYFVKGDRQDRIHLAMAQWRSEEEKKATEDPRVMDLLARLERKVADADAA